MLFSISPFSENSCSDPWGPELFDSDFSTGNSSLTSILASLLCKNISKRFLFRKIREGGGFLGLCQSFLVGVANSTLISKELPCSLIEDSLRAGNCLKNTAIASWIRLFRSSMLSFSTTFPSCLCKYNYICVPIKEQEVESSTRQRVEVCSSGRLRLDCYFSR